MLKRKKNNIFLNSYDNYSEGFITQLIEGLAFNDFEITLNVFNLRNQHQSSNKFYSIKK